MNHEGAESDDSAEGHVELAIDPDQYATVAEFFAALASPVRLSVVHRLTERGWSVTELATELGVSQPLMSQHLRILRAARIVTATRTGRSTTYSLVDDHVAHVVLDAIHHTEERP